MITEHDDDDDNDINIEEYYAMTGGKWKKIDFDLYYTIENKHVFYETILL